MNARSQKKSKPASPASQPNTARSLFPGETTPSDLIERNLEKYPLHQWKNRWQPFLVETLKLENFPFVVLFTLSAISLLSRIWLIRQ